MTADEFLAQCKSADLGSQRRGQKAWNMLRKHRPDLAYICGSSELIDPFNDDGCLPWFEAWLRLVWDALPAKWTVPIPATMLKVDLTVECEED